MINRIHSTLPVRLATLAVITASWLGLAHDAQAQAVPGTTEPDATAGSRPTSPPGYRSAMEGYQPYTDEKTTGWKQANDNVGRIGGWREYAREASSSSPPDPAEGDKPASPAVPGTQVRPHSSGGHKP